MTEFLQGVSNINAANNLINENIFDVILKYRDRLDSLKVINLTHNPINIDVKILGKMEEVKKMNIVITLWMIDSFIKKVHSYQARQRLIIKFT